MTKVETFLENFITRNKMENASSNDWCISPMPKSSFKQVKVQLNDGKSYDYACRYNVCENAVAVIGTNLPEVFVPYPGYSTNTGNMGQVEDILEKLAIRRDYAVEVDYIFNVNPQKKDLTQCVKYLDFGPESYDKTLMFDKYPSCIYPLTYFIRRILTATSILSHPKMVKPEEVELAKNVILTAMCMDKQMVELKWGPPEDIGVDLAGIHIADKNVIEVFEKIKKELDGNDEWWENHGELQSMSNILGRFASLDTVNDFINKYAHMGAVSIMIRGGFSNLLNAYLSVNPPIESFLDEILNLIDGVGYSETYDILKSYKK